MYTKSDLEAIEKAIFDLQSGKRVTSVAYGDTHVQYASIDLDDLLKRRSQIIAELKDGANGGIRRMIFSTSKGLR
ncbi:MAG: hypothetical protein IJ730_04540 [Alphaproteobacteria bacterium]|nr:hypothetical protein [Alphaproteobacteria bacterium]